jgi:5-methylcytosine-specific restriction endonuclease McrA
MPIKPENKNRYPGNWPAISQATKDRAGNKCEFCGLDNYAIGYRDLTGNFHAIEKSCSGDIEADEARQKGYKIIQIILTVAHLDHTPENCSPDNLKALCQRCHNRYDTGHRKQSRHETKYKTQYKIF